MTREHDGDDHAEPAHETGGRRTTKVPTSEVGDTKPAGIPQRPQKAHQRVGNHRTGRAPANDDLSREKQAQRRERTAPQPRGGVKFRTSQALPSRGDPAARVCTDSGDPLGSDQNSPTPKACRVCAYAPCGASLDGMDARAIYCSRRHKETARRNRRQRNLESGPRVGTCSVCGASVPVEEQDGALPKYCARHHPKQPCRGCGKILRHHAVSQFCRACQATKRIIRPAQTWTCLCDTCGAVFEAPAGTNFCDKHDNTKEDQR
jgi:hypothetical protein